MPTQVANSFDTMFQQDVYDGLTSHPKYLYSKYIYDQKGDALFQDIMAMPEYYLTGCEYEIIDTHSEEIASLFEDKETGFDLIELGAGDGKKTKVLLRELVAQQIDVTYKPIDISQNAIDSLAASLTTEFPHLEVAPERGEYFKVLNRLKSFTDRKKVIMVLGSNIGNLLHPKAINFLTQLQQSLAEGDLLFMGFDQKKHPQTILDAYNDPAGITEAFNKNILHRINAELGGDFEVDKFTHWEVYDPETGTAKSFLVATEAMKVCIDALDLTITFDPWETIHTEISQKYNDKIVSWLAEESGLRIRTSYSDQKMYYKNYVFEKGNG
ncbi:L-histidine N(alpha)-methyltransferase [Altibacter sp. HG106]|uniref:L-histidine N(alpha)-methyltransferase n=1 Tax=Altibacter sp. HG106 TaxID=3023937 RepID=UPI00235013F7|nr:L-histidine N(alpha)-methyltransferase [Altibacter sp. HG106]MDC7994578.1 L-histidine N(alpha)-methyltransferase [Altibacter sp. HG106]